MEQALGATRRTSCRQPVRRVPARAVFAAMAAALPGAAATINFTVDRGVEAIDVRASAVLTADAATAWPVLTAYDRYTDFIPDLRRSHVLARSGSKVTVEQTGYAAVWLLKLPIQVTIEVDEVPPNRLHSHAIAGSLRSLTSSYTLTPLSKGTRLDYVGHVVPGFAFFARIEQAAVEQNMARQFQALVDEIDHQAARASAPPAEAAR
jgi:hypothetical protein